MSTSNGSAGRRWPVRVGVLSLVSLLSTSLLIERQSYAWQDSSARKSPLIQADPELFPPLTEPPCSYCSTQNRKGMIKPDDRVIAWLRAAHNGGAIPIRHFLSAPRVINDTYGLFFYDPDGGYVAAYRKNYGFKLYGYRGGVMVVQSKDGTLWSALTGLAIQGPQQGSKLERIASMTTTWQHWMMLHPESTAYDLFDGKRYQVKPLPTGASQLAQESRAPCDTRLAPEVKVLGLEGKQHVKAYVVDGLDERACLLDKLDDQELAVFWYAPTQSAVAFERTLDGRTLTFYADPISPESAPFKDRETGSRWTLAGRAVDGPLRGKELNWVDSIQCRWYAWSHEYPHTLLYEAHD